MMIVQNMRRVHSTMELSFAVNTLLQHLTGMSTEMCSAWIVYLISEAFDIYPPELLEFFTLAIEGTQMVEQV